MKAAWPKKTLGEVCQFRGGGTPSKAVERFWQGDIPWVSPKDMKFEVVSDSIDHVSPEAIESSATSLIPKDSVLMVVRSGILARTVPIAITGRELTINQDLKALCPKGPIHARFLYHLLDSKMDVLLSKVSRGATVHRLISDDIRSLDFVLPPLPEQQRIVAILDEAFDGIATAKANAEKNLQNARALFESLLRAELIPQRADWLSTTIGEQVTLQRGFDITKEQQNPGSVPVVSSGGVKSFHDTAMIHAPGVVIGRKGTLGKVFYLEDDYWPHDTTLWIKQFNGNDPRFVYYFFTNLDVAKLDSGTANPALNRNQVHPIKVKWPPIAQQKSVVAKLDALSAAIQRLEVIYRRKIAALEALKKSLLHQAFSGEL